MPDSSNVTASKPGISGALHRAPAGTTLPTDATTALDAAFIDMGYLSDEGLTHDQSVTTEVSKAFGGDIVNVFQTERKDDFRFTLLESLRLEVLKMVYGESNVSGSLSTGITINAKPADLGEYVYVIDMILKDNAVERIVTPKGRISGVGETVYQDNDNIGFETTITALSDASGNTHYAYIKAASA